MHAPFRNQLNQADASLAISGHPSSHPGGMSPERTDTRFMFAQFQNRYPTGSITSELLEIHQGQYLVRVSVQVEGAILATGMAAAKRVELAEDRARVRALEVLGIHPATAEVNYSSAISPSTYQVQAHLMSSNNEATFSSELQPGTEVKGFLEHSPGYESREMNDFQTTSLPLFEQTYDEVPPVSPQTPIEAFEPIETSFEPSENSYDPPQPALPPNRPLSPSASNGKTVAQPQKQAKPKPAFGPTDLSDVIAQTTLEIKRLRWTEAEGRNYLMRTYGKRSRQYLTEEELLQFLKYLQSQPSPQPD